ncbi:alpha/beta hydrolase [Pseudalkalibacillus caeni]|uniref:Alpha/beta hydrolase n=1 Tax=Exobacillus caeni TaxID=2574798 RepID=A0A5R9F2C7_9BACL|nr:alpha/beta hydrolase [Pseudalkalibacillus caeni]TLS37822.1 alpha/beta hydrolase [Pseudalkalibacillus caeni]
MGIRERYLSLDKEWNIIHLPEQPNGFSVFILGDINHFVDQKTSFWIQNHYRYGIIKDLLNKGYTVFYSNLYGRNWGSPKAIELAKKLYQIIMRQETLNYRIHILAEGMGALTALHLMEDMPESIRSAVFINPCLDLNKHIKQEQENKLFYKRLLKEISEAYEVTNEQLRSIILEMKPIEPVERPVKIWHKPSRSLFSLSQSRNFEEFRKKAGSPIELSLISEQRNTIGKAISRFYGSHEKKL